MFISHATDGLHTAVGSGRYRSSHPKANHSIRIEGHMMIDALLPIG